MAGAYQTPRILEVSGIGNPDILSKHDIHSIVPLPGVGENLRERFSCRLIRIMPKPFAAEDHFGITTISEVDTPEATVDDMYDPVFAQEQQDL